jgi:nitrogen regulatory protein P-II 1
MKAIHAYVRRSLVARVIERLLDHGCTNFSVFDVHRLTPGLRREEYSYSLELSQAYEGVAKLEVVGLDDQIAQWADVIVEAASTGQVGDGMVFVLPVEEAIRISTKQRGETALGHG